jgi:hypothetical protein
MDDYIADLKARWLVLHNDTILRLQVAEHFVATMASQPMPDDRDDVNDVDWKYAFSKAITIARQAAKDMKDMERSP